MYLSCNKTQSPNPDITQSSPRFVLLFLHAMLCVCDFFLGFAKAHILLSTKAFGLPKRRCSVKKKVDETQVRGFIYAEPAPRETPSVLAMERITRNEALPCT
jgi:hypothetical protein